MNHYFLPVILIFLTACSVEKKENKPEQLAEMQIEKDSSPRITGVGGIFFFSDDPEKLKSWYSENLGLTTDDYGAVFEFRNAIDSREINYLRWGLFSRESTHFQPSEKDFMINYRVYDLEGMVKNLNDSGITLLDSIHSYPYGKFAHLMDPGGNKIELWEPVDSVLTEMGGRTVK